MKTGVIDVGGGLRGIYAAGVFDYCLDTGLRFDLCIGVSAGSANIASFLGGQKGRNYRFYTEYSFRKEYMGLRNYIFQKSYLDLDYIYGTLSNSGGEDPLDYRQISENPAQFLVVATDALTGNAVYFDKSSITQDDYSVFKASSAIPLVCHPYSVAGIPYFDGALADAVPLEKAFSMGCDRAVLILTRPINALRSPKNDRRFARRLSRKYPMAAQSLLGRADSYNRSVALALELEKQGKVLVVAPDDTCGVETLTKDRAALIHLYKKGYRDGARILNFIGSP